MELIPILSAIILIATISTFILAIGAYILYKVREKRGNAEKQQGYRQVEAELIAPRTKFVEAEEEFARKEYAYAPINKEARGKDSFETSVKLNSVLEGAEKKDSSKFFKYTPDGYVPIDKSAVTEKTEDNLKWR